MDKPSNEEKISTREIPVARWLGIEESSVQPPPPPQTVEEPQDARPPQQPRSIVNAVERIRQLGRKEIRLPEWTGLRTGEVEQPEPPKSRDMPPSEVVGPYSPIDMKSGNKLGISGITKQEINDLVEDMFLWNFFPYAAMNRRRKRKPKIQRSQPIIPEGWVPPVEPTPTAEPVSQQKTEDSSYYEKISNTIEGLVKSIETISEDVQYAKTSMDAMKESLKNISTVKSVDLRPQTIEMAGKQFLYYPGAPEGRQFYEKTAEGTAGANAPRGMKEALSRKVATAPQPNVNFSQVIQQTTNSNLKIVERLLAQEMPNQEAKIAELLRKIATRELEGGALGMEADEQEAMLERALEKALTKVLRRMPEASGGLGGGQGGGGGLADLASAAPTTSGGFGGPLRPNAPTPPTGRKGILGKLGGLFSMRGLAKLGGKSALKKLPLGLGLAFGLGFGAERALAGDYTGAAMEIGSGAASVVPGVGTAASLGIDATLAARDAGVLGATNVVPTQQIVQPRETVSSTQQIVQPIEIQRQLAKDTGLAINGVKKQDAVGVMSEEIPVRALDRATISRAQSLMAEPVTKTTNRPIVPMATTPVATQTPAPTIINNITNNRVAPSTKIPDEEQSQIRVFPTENTFNRLIAQDFDHPSTYHSMSMG